MKITIPFIMSKRRHRREMDEQRRHLDNLHDEHMRNVRHNHASQLQATRSRIDSMVKELTKIRTKRDFVGGGYAITVRLNEHMMRECSRDSKSMYDIAMIVGGHVAGEITSSKFIQDANDREYEDRKRAAENRAEFYQTTRDVPE